MKKIDIILGVRSDFIQGSSLYAAFSAYEDILELRYIHTGEDTDHELSTDIIDQLGLHINSFLPEAGNEGIRKFASIMLNYDEHMIFDKPDLILVFGNSDSALAATMVGSRNSIPVGHIDAGARFLDHSVIEEQNDLQIDRLSTYLFTSNEESVINLIREGYDNRNIIEVGNLRSDSVFMNLGFAEDSDVLERNGLISGNYILLTLHHDHILKNTEFLISFFNMLEDLSSDVMIYVCLHPKTSNLLDDLPELILDPGDNFQLVSSRNYQDMLKLQKNAALVVTDSQGLQDETTILGVNCLTLGNSSNRPATFSKGTNSLAGFDISRIRSFILAILSGESKDGYPIDNWDGKVGQRIAKFITELS
mgnify:CR=1 FL=1